MVATAKVSLSMDRHALALAKTAADRTGMSLSSLVNAALERHLGEVLAELQRRKAAEEVIATFPVTRLPSAKHQQQLLTLWSRGGTVPTEAEIESAFGAAPRRRRTQGQRTTTRKR
ncbi:MAG: hypothetical protein ACRENE_01550 [Polyangiaceae bacterium]